MAWEVIDIQRPTVMERRYTFTVIVCLELRILVRALSLESGCSA
jgi:hypothetical protein